MTRTPRNRQASVRARGRARERHARLRRAARATGVAIVFALSTFAGFGTEPTAVRPIEVAESFEPRPFAISFAVRQEIARAREARRIALAAQTAWEGTAALAYAAPTVPTAPGPAAPSDPLERFDDLTDGAVALAAPVAAVPVPTMRPGDVGRIAP